MIKHSQRPVLHIQVIVDISRADSMHKQLEPWQPSAPPQARVPVAVREYIRELPHPFGQKGLSADVYGVSGRQSLVDRPGIHVVLGEDDHALGVANVMHHPAVGDGARHCDVDPSLVSNVLQFLLNGVCELASKEVELEAPHILRVHVLQEGLLPFAVSFPIRSSEYQVVLLRLCSAVDNSVNRRKSLLGDRLHEVNLRNNPAEPKVVLFQELITSDRDVHHPG
mmetsp:Transcript_14684/g.41312  ORF Transcript_14684/g.41312 Transcript_14684/m.41312 type:complete len:224 (+) Transcript_14684:117-788(+)